MFYKTVQDVGHALVWQFHKECDTFGVTRLCHDIKTHFCTQTVKACIYNQMLKRV